MLANNKPGGDSSSSPSQYDGNAMEIAALHFEALQKYLLTHILKEKQGVNEQRVAAREKLSKLLPHQRLDLSTDVYDELKRRTDGKQVPFLAVRSEFHPKRNQARQKLATLHQGRFKDLASDVYVELERYFPHLQEMFPLKALEEKEFLSQPPPSQQESTIAIQQSSVVPNVATFTIQDSSNAEEDDTYYRAPGQGPASPAALEGNVSFASLDSLMADIGNIVKDGPDSAKGNKGSDPTRPPRSSESGDPAHQEYEARIQALCKRLQHLESEVGDGINRPEGSRLAQVERQLAKQTELYNEQLARSTKLQVDYNKVLNDYHAQLETVDMMNQEVRALAMDHKSMKQRNMEVEEELQSAYKKIKQLENENKDLKADIDEALRGQRSFPDAPAPRSVIKENISNVPAPMSPPVAASNINDPMNNHNDDHHSDHELENDTKEDRGWNHDRVQARMSVMVNPGSVVHTDSLDNFRNAIDDLLQAGRSDSSSSVLLSMKSVVIACKAVTEDVEEYEHGMGDEDTFVELKQELSSGLTQLMTAAKVHSNAFNEDEEEFERTLVDLENAADQLEAIVMDIVNIPKSNTSKKGAGRGGMDNNHHAMGRDHDDDLPIHDNMHSGPPGGNASHNNNDEPMDALDLKMYLEKETATIVSTIQTLLTALRSNSDTRGISDASDNITKVVDQVIRQTRMTLATPEAVNVPQAEELRSQGEMVLEDLENSLEMLIEVRDQLEAEPELVQSSSADAKAIKQKMASASFDIAKYAKELVSLIED
ncbi:component of the polarisome [Mortierella sp. NVP85]|nr:component of the polarisome [Mortierella sp. NVP85]